MVQRSLAARSQSDAGRALILSGFAVFVQFALFLWIGIALARFYEVNQPDMVFEKGDRVFSHYIVHELPAGIGLIGVLLAAVFSAAISTLSSSLNSSATAVVSDWIVPARRKSGGMDQTNIVTLSRVLTVVFGIVQIVIGIWAASWDDAVVNNALAIAGFAAGLLLGLFALGTFCPRARQVDAVIGLVAGLSVLLYVKFGMTTPVAWPWLPVIGSTTTYAFGWASSVFFGATHVES